jgi:transcriptional regulator with XRE-family HTH domain
MKDRIQAFLQNENKSYAQFAEEIGVQPSGISHILSGRNNPSLDFVIKMLHRYPALAAEWLLFGRGPMYKFVSQPTLFDVEMPLSSSAEDEGAGSPELQPEASDASESLQKAAEGVLPVRESNGDGSKRLTRIVMFYSDKTFTEYNPS